MCNCTAQYRCSGVQVYRTGYFRSVLAGNAPTRYFIPFPRDSFPGRVVSFDPPKVNTDLSLAAHIIILASHSLLIS